MASDLLANRVAGLSSAAKLSAGSPQTAAGGMLAPHSEGWPGGTVVAARPAVRLLAELSTGWGPGTATAHESLVVLSTGPTSSLRTGVATWLSAQDPVIWSRLRRRTPTKCKASGIGFCATELATTTAPCSTRCAVTAASDLEFAGAHR